MLRRTFMASLLALPLATRVLAKGCEVRGVKPSTVVYPEVPKGLRSVFVIGDFGTGGLLQKKVADAMDHIAAVGKPLAIVSTGDNIYPDGVKSADDSQWKRKFEDVYALEHLQSLKWIAVPGNHDYRGSVEAQVAYGKRNVLWNMPNAYFSMPCPQGEDLVTFVCLDTQAILTKTDGWKAQLNWLETELGQIKTPWKIVVGHHPIRSYGHYQDQDWMLTHVKPLLDQGGVQAYLCGHDHDLQVIQHPADVFACVISGGGGGCRSTSWGAHSKAVATGGGFAVLHMDEKALYAQVVDSSASNRGTVLISKREMSR